MTDLFNELNEIIGEGLFKNIEQTKDNKKIYTVEVQFYVEASNVSDALSTINKAIDTASYYDCLKEVKDWEIENVMVGEYEN
tara:strand:- start:9934 stop:10179 length:246 start_codon:yes stop_codon:yes gene_type:complete